MCWFGGEVVKNLPATYGSGYPVKSKVWDPADFPDLMSGETQLPGLLRLTLTFPFFEGSNPIIRAPSSLSNLTLAASQGTTSKYH